jgi:membrane fusion protein (multidrug efflux system)
MNAPTATSPLNRRLLLWVVPTVVAAVSIYFYGSTGRFVSTDNAYLQRDHIDVTPQVSGDVREVLVTENQHVSMGQTLAVIDDTLLQIASRQAASRLVAAREEVEALKAGYREKTGEIEVAKRASLYASRDLERQQELLNKKLTAIAQVDTARRNSDLATGAISVLQLQRQQIAARLGDDPSLPTDQFAIVKTAAAEVDRVRFDLDHTHIIAPQAGIVSHLPKVGNRLEIGRPAMAIVTEKNLWVEANFKETDLEWVQAGQPVEISIDTYPNHTWHGRVESLSAATGAQFSLLPPQNASGNWVKVVQRIPVRIVVQPNANDPPLRDGMSASIEIDTGAHSHFDRWLGRGR